jgi:multicomponent Na+:H+ antiporter subunit D
MTGTLNMADLAERLPTVSSSRTVIAAFAFITVGASLKLALFPLHLWLPNAYTYAPSAVSAFLAATATKVGVYVLLRFFFTVFGRDFSFEVTRVGEILLVLALVATLVASTVAFFQENVKRMLAYSSVAQVGYMILGASFATVDGLTASIIHLFNHALIKGGLFLALGCVFLRIGSVRIRDMEGLSKTMPLTMAAFVIGGLSLIGVPLTSGFISKWYLVQASLELGWWVVAVLILVSSLIAVAYVWRVVEAAYFRNPGPHAREAKEAPAIMLVSTWVLIGANLYFGIDASVSLEVARRAAETLIGTGP